MRFLIRGTRRDGSAEFDKYAEAYVTAASRDEALRHTGVTIFNRVDEVLEVPADAGRGPLSRFMEKVKARTSSPRSRILQLDVLRGLAILLVLFHHNPTGSDRPGPWQWASYYGWMIGWTGVDLFFVLSGYLIGGLLFKEIQKTGRLNVTRFLARRAWKIWPPYFALIAYAMYIRVRHGESWGEAFREFLPNFIHLQNYWGNVPQGHTWSLAVEEHFYLLLPLLLVLLMRVRNLQRLILVAAIVAFTCLALRFANWNVPYDLFVHYKRTHLRIDSLLFGVLLAYVQQYHASAFQPLKLARWRGALAVGGVTLVVPFLFIPSEHRFTWTVGYTLLYAGYGAILLAAVHTPLGQGWAGNLLDSRLGRCFAFVGFYSYSIYLWHVVMGRDPIGHQIYLGRFDNLPPILFWPTVMATYTGACVLAGLAMALLVERPTLWMRERFSPAIVRV